MVDGSASRWPCIRLFEKSVASLPSSIREARQALHEIFAMDAEGDVAVGAAGTIALTERRMHVAVYPRLTARTAGAMGKKVGRERFRGFTDVLRHFSYDPGVQPLKALLTPAPQDEATRVTRWGRCTISLHPIA